MLDRLRRASARDCTFSRSAAASGIVVVVRCVRFAIRRACRRRRVSAIKICERCPVNSIKPHLRHKNTTLPRIMHVPTVNTST